MSKKLDYLINLPTNLEKFIDETTTSIANVIDEGNAARAAERAAAQQRAAEGGFSDNEPMHVCVQQAIEKAITELVIKGIDRKVWRADT